MTWQEQMKLDAQWHFDNLAGAMKAGIEAAPKGAVIGAVATAPFSLLRNALQVVRGKISAQEAALETIKETAIGGVAGGTSAFTVVTIASACPPVAVALATLSPALLVAGGAGMVYQFFNILDNHKQEVKQYYESLTQKELERLQEVEDELVYEHQKNLAFIANAKIESEAIVNRPCNPGIQGALTRYLESVAMAQSLGTIPEDSNLLSSQEVVLLPHVSQ